MTRFSHILSPKLFMFFFFVFTFLSIWCFLFFFILWIHSFVCLFSWSVSSADIRNRLSGNRLTGTQLADSCPEKKTHTCQPQKFRHASSFCNNVQNPTWGSSDSTYGRLVPSSYSDGMGSRLSFDTNHFSIHILEWSFFFFVRYKSSQIGRFWQILAESSQNRRNDPRTEEDQQWLSDHFVWRLGWICSKWHF